MTNPNEPTTNGAAPAAGLDYAQEAFQRILEQLRDQQGVIDRQQAEIEEFRRDAAEWRKERCQILDHLGYGPETCRPLTPEDIKEMDESGRTLQQLIAELNAMTER